MPKIIFHIGLPKTGTTTIQKNILNKFQNQLNPHNLDPLKRTVKKQIGYIFRERSPEEWGESLGREAINNLIQLVNENEEPFIYSHEGLCLPYFYEGTKKPSFIEVEKNKFPVAAHLQSIMNHYPELYPMRVVVSLRNQPEWLASLYAQQSRNIKNASQEDFEKRTKDLLSINSTKGRRFLYYDSLIEQLSSIVGNEEVFMLFLEEMETSEFWGNLIEAFNIQENKLSQHDISRDKKNVRKIDEKTWKIHPFEGYKKKFMYKKLKSLKYYIKYKKFIHENILNKDRGFIKLSRELDNQIKDTYRESNIRLQELIGRELNNKYK